MAISKIMHMKDCGHAYHGKHLKLAIDYITEKWKTQDGSLIGTVNCFPSNVYEQMRDTKLQCDKNDGRQGYHIVLSFQPEEVEADKAFEIAGKFAERYLGNRYEVVYAVHDNTDCIHAHLIWNSVSFLDGRKYHYKKGDWEKDILPLMNELCREYGLSVLELDGERAYAETEEKQKGYTRTPVWNEMIKRDVDACILQAETYAEFLELLMGKGYECKEGKYLSIKPPGMERFRRCHTLGEDYAEEELKRRIQEEQLRPLKPMQQPEAHIVYCHVKSYKRAKLSGLQKKYYAKLYQTGALRNRPYSQAWKYRKDIERLHTIQKQYLFLEQHEVKDVTELAAVLLNLKEKEKGTATEKQRVYRRRQRYKPLFQIAEQMKPLLYARDSYENGDISFQSEYQRWCLLEEELKEKGYSYEEVVKLKASFKEEIAEVAGKAAAVKRELTLANSIWQEVNLEAAAQREPEERKLEETKEQESQKAQNQLEKGEVSFLIGKEYRR